MTTKTCSCCGEAKPEGEFYLSSYRPQKATTPRPRMPWCKACVKRRVKQRREERADA